MVAIGFHSHILSPLLISLSQLNRYEYVRYLGFRILPVMFSLDGEALKFLLELVDMFRSQAKDPTNRHDGIRSHASSDTGLWV